MSSKGLAGNNNQVPPGYKKTEVGVIPEDWKVIRIQTAIDEKYIEDHMDGNHGELYPKSHEFISYGIPYVGANDFLNGRVNFKGCKFLSEARSKKFQKGIARDGDVLFAHNATVGSVALANFNGDFFILSTTATYFRCNTERLNNFYFRFVLDSQYFIKQYSAVMVQSTRYQVPITTQRKFFIAIPPLPEQKAIAQTLSDVDALIAALDKLIAKKRNIKTATMQQLLTGKTRLPGFAEGKGYKKTEVGVIPEDWEVRELGSLATIQRGASPRPINSPIWYDSKSAVGWVRISDITNSDGKNLKVTQDYLSKQGISQSRYLPIGSLIMSICATVGIPVITRIESCIHDGFVGFSNLQDIDQEFLYYKLKDLETYFKSKGQTGSQSNLNSDIVRFCVIPLPHITEQKAIAQVLSDMDKEITALEKRRAKTQAIKQGMMQELLTGRTRLINN